MSRVRRKDGPESGLAGRRLTGSTIAPLALVNDAPMAITSDGSLVVSMTHIDGDVDDVAAKLRQLLDEGHEVFVGVVVPAGLRRELDRDLEEVLADVVGRLGPRLRSRRRP